MTFRIDQKILLEFSSVIQILLPVDSRHINPFKMNYFVIYLGQPEDHSISKFCSYAITQIRPEKSRNISAVLNEIILFYRSNMLHLLNESQKIHASLITEIKLCQNLNTPLTHFLRIKAGMMLKWIFHWNQQINSTIELTSFMGIFGYIDVGDGCWRRNVLVTIWKCWWRFWPFRSPTSSIA